LQNCPDIIKVTGTELGILNPKIEHSVIAPTHPGICIGIDL
jgi:alkyl hydroperoxide reductase subunit AhpF